MIPTTPEPKLIDRAPSPKGVIQKHTKGLVYFGAVAILILALMVSTFRKKAPATPDTTKDRGTAPTVQDNTANNVATFHQQLAAEKQNAQQEPSTQLGGTPAQQAQLAGYGSNGLPPASAPGYVQAGQGSGGQPQLSPEQQEAQALEVKERERLYAARFASNIAYSSSAEERQPNQAAPAQQNPYAASPQPGQPTNFTTPRAAGEPVAPTYQRATEVNLDSATGQPYVIYEGLTLDTVLMNRLDGDAAGPVKVLVSSSVYSHDHQHVLIPEGTIVLGEARKIGANGFGQQRRVAVAFHRMLMPDGYSVDLDQFHGLDQIGEEGLKDKVNNHYLQIFGTSIALGVISGAAQITQGGTGYNSNGSQQFVNGASAGISQQATTVLDKFIQIPPTITIREGHRVKVYFTQDMLLPAYSNHTIAQSF